MSLIGSLIVGLIVGAIARFIYPGRENMGWLMTMLLGIGGSIVAQFGGQALGFFRPGAPVGWIASVIGALVLLFVYNRLVSAKR